MMTLPYIKNTSETTNRLLQSHSITVALKPTEVFQSILNNPKDPEAQAFVNSCVRCLYLECGCTRELHVEFRKVGDTQCITGYLMDN